MALHALLPGSGCCNTELVKTFAMTSVSRHRAISNPPTSRYLRELRRSQIVGLRFRCHDIAAADATFVT